MTIDLAALDGAPAALRPHIFVFVIDSLRRDYVSPYNRQVSFTPALERFARESTVFERAFTRYGPPGCRCRRCGWEASCCTSSR